MRQSWEKSFDTAHYLAGIYTKRALLALWEMVKTRTPLLLFFIFIILGFLLYANPLVALEKQLGSRNLAVFAVMVLLGVLILSGIQSWARNLHHFLSICRLQRTWTPLSFMLGIGISMCSLVPPLILLVTSSWAVKTFLWGMATGFVMLTLGATVQLALVPDGFTNPRLQSSQKPKRLGLNLGAYWIYQSFIIPRMALGLASLVLLLAVSLQQGAKIQEVLAPLFVFYGPMAVGFFWIQVTFPLEFLKLARISKLRFIQLHLTLPVIVVLGLGGATIIFGNGSPTINLLLKVDAVFWIFSSILFWMGTPKPSLFHMVAWAALLLVLFIVSQQLGLLGLLIAMGISAALSWRFISTLTSYEVATI